MSHVVLIQQISEFPAFYFGAKGSILLCLNSINVIIFFYIISQWKKGSCWLPIQECYDVILSNFIFFKYKQFLHL